jgi:predicted GNAT family acetyltransferase
MKKLFLLSLLFSLPAVAMEQVTKKNYSNNSGEVVKPVTRQTIDFKKLLINEYFDIITRSIHFEFLHGSDHIAKSEYCIYQDKISAHLDHIEVTNLYRKQGIGSKVLAYTLQQIIIEHPKVTEVHWSIIPLDNSTDLAKLCAFYKKETNAEIRQFSEKSCHAQLNLITYKKEKMEDYHEL